MGAGMLGTARMVQPGKQALEARHPMGAGLLATARMVYPETLSHEI